jgi:hypothetical protein
VTERPIYHREESSSQTAQTAVLQIDSQEMWGGPARNTFQSDIPKVKAFHHKLPQDSNGMRTKKGIEFNTEVEPDRGTRPGLLYWSGEREGVRNEDGYAKIKVKIRFCNQLEQDYIADD